MSAPGEEDFPSTHTTLAALVQAFFTASKRDRYLHLISSERGYERFIRDLAHVRGLRSDATRPIASALQSPEGILAELTRLGAPADCMAFSEAPELDRQTMGLRDALTRVVGSGSATLISCVPGVLAYYEGESAGERWILAR